MTSINEVTETAVAEWIDRYYKNDRLTRESGTRGRIIADRLDDMQRYGRTLISRHDSVTGNPEWLSVNS
ncbi:hypothetical protein [Nocardia wallacei]|uniref:hypothetical protein n=1 Tax=Nocardia wallacei TaxID=480035 RepID=UPI0024583895|nr:hypothetical protein [Nocardia wallacei]